MKVIRNRFNGFEIQNTFYQHPSGAITQDIYYYGKLISFIHWPFTPMPDSHGTVAVFHLYPKGQNPRRDESKRN